MTSSPSGASTVEQFAGEAVLPRGQALDHRAAREYPPPRDQATPEGNERAATREGHFSCSSAQGGAWLYGGSTAT